MRARIRAERRAVKSLKMSSTVRGLEEEMASAIFEEWNGILYIILLCVDMNKI